MSTLKIGLVASNGNESEQLARLLEASGAQVLHNIPPENIVDKHVEDESLHVWLLNIDDDSWHDSVDHLLDESETPVYFCEPGTLDKQSHPEYWCDNLLVRLHEITGLPQSVKIVEEPEVNLQTSEPQEKENNESEIQSESLQEESEELSPSENLETPLAKSIEDLELTTADLPSDIAAELVCELESISPVLSEEISDNKEQDLIQENTIDEVSDHDIQTIDEIDFDTNSENEIEILDDVVDESLEKITAIQNEENLTLEDINFEDTQSELSFDNLDDGDSSSTESEFNLDIFDDTESEQESDFANIDLADDDLELQEISDELSIDDETLNEENLNDELEVAKEQTEEQQLDAQENVEIKESALELSLESIEGEEPEVIEGKAHFIIDDEDELIDEAGSSIETEKTLEESDEEILSELQLEPLADQKPVTGKANFIEDIEEESTEDLDVTSKADQVTEHSQNESSDEIGVSSELSLEPMNDSNDITLNEAESDNIELNQAESAKTQSEDEIFAEEAQEPKLDHLSLEIDSVELENEPLTDVDNVADDLSTETELSVDNDSLDIDMSTDIELDEETISKIAREALADDSLLDDEITAEINDKPTEALEEAAVNDIPMLDEAVSNVVFEEKAPSQVNKDLTPCWVIGASLGGPAAVKRFLNRIPADINASFVIAQHIDENFLPVLADILTTSSHFDVKIAQGSTTMKAGDVYLAPLKGKLVIFQDGSMFVDHSQKWSPPYSPCINDVIDSVSQVYKELGGAIIFSGMGEDGLAGSQKMRKQGGKVWAQSVDTCANSSMPESVINNGESDYIGTPEELADKLIDEVNRSQILAS